MLAAPLLLACLLVPQDAPPAPDAPRPRTVAEWEAALDVPLRTEPKLRPGDTLAEALHRLAMIHQIRILPDAARLDVAAIDLRDLTIDNPPELEGIKLRSALNLLLESVNDEPLTYLVVDGVLKITTQDYADEFLTTRTYAVRDLLEAAGPWAAVARSQVDQVRFSSGGHSGVITSMLEVPATVRNEAEIPDPPLTPFEMSVSAKFRSSSTSKPSPAASTMAAGG